MVLSAVMTTCMNLIIKYQTSYTKINALQAVMLRSMFLAIGSYSHLKKDGKSLIDIPQRLWKYILMRALFGFMSSTLMYLSLDYIPLSQGVTVYYT